MQNFNDLAIVSVNGGDYRTNFWYLSEDDAINMMNNSSPKKKVGHYDIFIEYMIF